jgi:hypothetical protein
MIDVRLTATNPEDSTLVPVPCNVRGELLTVAPVIEVIPNDLEIQGDLTVTGTINDSGRMPEAPLDGAAYGRQDGEWEPVLMLTGGDLAGNLTLGTDNITLNATTGSAVFESSVNGSAFYSPEPTGTSALAKLSWFHFYLADSAGDKTVEIKNDGSITAAGDVKVGNINTTGNAPTDKGINLFNSGQISCQLDGTVPSGTQLGIQQWYGSTKTFEVFNDGSASFAGLGVFGSYTNGLDNATDTSFRVNSEYLKGEAFNLRANGNAKFSGDVTVSSRNKMWMLVEQGGLCHMVEQSRSIDPGFGVKKEEYPKLRDVFKELDLVEQALNDVMERLRMNPPAGWPVWDGSNETE